jgi:hypothetical protein
MPISGPVVHQQLMDIYNRLQQQYESDRSILVTAKTHRDELDSGRSETLLKLAEHYLPELTTDSLRETWVEVRPRIAEILRRQEAEVARFTTRLDEANREHHSLDDSLVHINRDLDDAIDRQESLSRDVEKKLLENKTFVELSDRAAMAEAALERAESNLLEIEQDAARKLPAYDKSKLFKYLHDLGFGTEAYTKKGFARRMDRMLAKYIGFNQAKQGYDFLRKTPEQMRQIISEDRGALDTVMKELEKCRDEVSGEVGLTAQVNLVAGMMKRRDQTIRRLNEVLVQIDTEQKNVASASDTRGPYYREAISVFREMLAQIDTRDLKRRAKSTIDLTDDQIVARLEGVDGQISQLEEAARQRRDELTNRQRLIAELGQLIQQYRAAGFDSGRSQFAGSFDVVTEVQQAMSYGSMGSLWQSLRSAQRWGPSAMEQLGRVASHPMTQVLINAMAHAAGGALEAHVRRANQRRHHGHRDDGSSWGPWDSSRW